VILLSVPKTSYIIAQYSYKSTHVHERIKNNKSAYSTLIETNVLIGIIHSFVLKSMDMAIYSRKMYGVQAYLWPWILLCACAGTYNVYKHDTWSEWYKNRSVWLWFLPAISLPITNPIFRSYINWSHNKQSNPPSSPLSSPRSVPTLNELESNSDVCDRSLTQEAWSRSQGSPCWFCGGQIVTETEFSTTASVCLLVISPTVFRNYIHSSPIDTLHFKYW
jgi:hypothetical protein